MKINSFKKILIPLFLVTFCLNGNTQTLRNVENTAFINGEKLTFNVYYYSAITGKVNAGEAKLEVKNMQ